MKIKKGDKVVVISGVDKGKEGKVLFVDRKNNKLIVEGVNMIKKHQKPAANQQGGIIQKEAAIDASNVMYLYKGKPTRLGYKVEKIERDGKMVNSKQRIARPSGEIID